MLEQELIRRIGSGESTRIWCINWLPRVELLKPVCSTSSNPPHLVSELIDLTMSNWDHEKLLGCFTPMDRELIANIPLSTMRMDDFWAWHYERYGVFFGDVRYRMLVHNSATKSAWLEEEMGSLTYNLWRRSGPKSGRLKCPKKSVCFYGGLLGSLFQLKMYVSAET